MTDTARRLRTALDDGVVVAPGVYDMISARLADRLGFPALYMTGYGVVASFLGMPDAGLATYSEMEGRVAAIAGGTETPVIADADTGFGGPLNVERTVRGYERAGAAAIQIEDQEFPKRCGHTPGRRVVAPEEMVRKVRVAAATRDSADFLIIARTDARTTLGLDEALRRAEAYLAAGADALFVEAPESEEELARIGETFPGVPLLANMVEGGCSPVLPVERLAELGFRIVIHPVLGFLSAAAAMEEAYGTLRRDGRTEAIRDRLHSFDAFNRFIGFERVWDFERHWAPSATPERTGR